MTVDIVSTEKADSDIIVKSKLIQRKINTLTKYGRRRSLHVCRRGDQRAFEAIING